MPKAADPRDRESWGGGSSYQMELTFEPTAADLLEQAWLTLETAAKLRRGGRGWLVRLPDGRRTTCAIDGGHDSAGGAYLLLLLPEGGLAQVYRQVRQHIYPLDPDPHEMSWRRPIDDWLAALGAQVFAVAPFRVGRIGWNVTMRPPEVPRRLRRVAGLALLVPNDGGLEYLPAAD